MSCYKINEQIGSNNPHFMYANQLQAKVNLQPLLFYVIFNSQLVPLRVSTNTQHGKISSELSLYAFYPLTPLCVGGAVAL